MKTLVLGGGISGILTAYFLAGDGHEVIVVERHGGVAREASFANAGMVCPSMAEPWGSPGAPSGLIRSLGRNDAPLRLRIGAVPGMWRWGLRFLGNCSHERFRRNTRTNVRLALYSAEVFQMLREDIDVAYDLQRVGSLRIHTDAKVHEEAARACEALTELGLTYRVVDAAECARIEPALGPAAHTFAGGIFYPDDENGDCFKFAQAASAAARARGVSFMFDTTVTGFIADGDSLSGIDSDRGPLRAECVVVALGSRGVDLVRRIGIDLPIYPVKGLSITVPVAGWDGAPRVTIVDVGRKFGVVRIGDSLRVAGSAEFGGFDETVDPDRCRVILDNAAEVLPELRRRLDPKTTTRWAGLRPTTPDGPPILGASPIRNLFINTGGGHLGWTFAPGAARIVADTISGRRAAIDLDGLTLARFR